MAATVGTLGALPSEIILLVASHLDVPHVNSFLQTGRRFHWLLQPLLYQLAHTYTRVPVAGTPLIWAVQNGQMGVLHALLEPALQGNGWPSDNHNRTTALHQAITHKNEEALEVLVKAGADILVQDVERYIPLQTAARENLPTAVRVLLDAHRRKPEWSEFQPEWGMALQIAAHLNHGSVCKTLLQHPAIPHDATTRILVNDALCFGAALAGHCDLTRLLCEYGGDLSTSSLGDCTILHVAAFTKNIEFARIGLEYGVDPLILSGEIQLHDAGLFIQPGMSAMHVATQRKCVGVMRALIEAGASLDMESRSNKTPLMLAVHFLSLEAAQCLIDAGADLRKRNHMGFDALDHVWADRKNRCDRTTEMVELLLNHGANPAPSPEPPRMTPLHWAATGGDAGSVALLCRAGAPVDRRDQRGRTALLLAVRDGKDDCVEALVQAGADLSVKDEAGASLLHLAVVHGHDTVVERLLQAGANPAGLDSNGHSPLHLAARYCTRLEGFCYLVQHCEKHSLNYLSRCRDGYSILEEAAAARYGDYALEELLQAGIDPNGGWEWSSALHFAAANHAVNKVKLLLSHGADPYPLDLYGRSALDWASTRADTFAAIIPQCEEYRPTDIAARRSRLHNTVATFTRRVLEGQKSAHQPYSNVVARALLFLENDVAASQFYSRNDVGETGGDRKWGCSWCHRHQPLGDVRFICRDCRDVDVCRTCLDESVAGMPPMLFCRDHRFFEVPPQATALPDEQEIGQAAAWKRWLERLIDKYTIVT